MEALNLVKMSKSDIKKLSLVKNGDMVLLLRFIDLMILSV